jgi:hypothetical protein
VTLSELAGARVTFGNAAGGMPASKPLLSPYRDSTQVFVKAAGEFSLSELAEDRAVVSGSCAVERPFRPQKIIAEVSVVAAHAAAGQPDLSLRHDLRSTRADLKWFILTEALFDGAQIFTPPSDAPFAISLATFAGDSLSSGVFMPDARQRIDIRVSVSKHLHLLVQDRLPLPAGYDKAPKSLAVEIVLHFFGPRVIP